ncbi:MAG: hypothetical protein ACYDCK_11590 [Thermoplasmatota archaeon]
MAWAEQQLHQGQGAPVWVCFNCGDGGGHSIVCVWTQDGAVCVDPDMLDAVEPLFHPP